MADVIEWGDEASERRRPRRLRRPRGWTVVGWLGIAAVVTGVALWPTAHGWLADRAAARIRDAWASAESLDEARSTAIERLLSEAGTFDGPSVGRGVRLIDDEEARRLLALRHGVDALRTWSEDVDRARRAVASGLLATATALRREAESEPSNPPPYPTDDAENSARQRAYDAVQALVGRHHLADATARPVTLHAADAILAQLKRPVDRPVGLDVITNDGSTIAVIDLDTGRTVRRLHVAVDPSMPASALVRIVGTSVLFTDYVNIDLVPLDGSKVVRLPEGDDISSAGDHVWLRGFNDSLAEYDMHGHLVRPATTGPGSLDIGGGIGNDDAFLGIRTTSSPGDNVGLWSPRTGRTTFVSLRGCWQGAAAAVDVLALLSSPTCSAPVDVITIVGDDGHVRLRTRLPGGAFLANADAVLAPNGRRLALRLSPSLDEARGGLTNAVGVLDLATGRWTVLPDVAHQWSPLAFSPDGTVLLLGIDDGVTSDQSVALWRSGDTRLESLRMPLIGSDLLLVSSAR